MDQNTSVNLVSQAMLLVLTSSLPPIIVATVVGLLIALFQALTQIQDQTLPFAVKIVATFLVIVYAMNYVFGDLYNFAMISFRDFPIMIN
ncbi:MAG: type III secretion system export apparatus subunit SctS [Chthoniobacterales bacterium]